ncbi:MAG: cache domain-containing protein [Thermoanaerobaculia bacterium]
MRRFARRSLTLLALAPAGLAAETPPLEHEESLALVALVHDAAAVLAVDGLDKACAAFRRPDSRWLHDDTYVFVLDAAGAALCHPVRPDLEGRSLLELADPKGHPIVASFLRETAGDREGFVHYQWPRPGEAVFVWKTTYVRRTRTPDSTEVVVGSGAYGLPMERAFVVEQVDDAVALIEAEGEAAFATLRDPASGFVFGSAYVFVLDRVGVLEVNHAFPQNEGQDVRELTDIDGRPFVREMLRVPVGGSAWIHYNWPRPGDTRPAAKSSYVRAIDWQGKPLYVGAGVYFDPEPAVRHLGPASDVPTDP